MAISKKIQKKFKNFTAKNQRIKKKIQFFLQKHLEVTKKYLPLRSQSETKGRRKSSLKILETALSKAKIYLTKRVLNSFK
jgi:hypothetical protein